MSFQVQDGILRFYTEQGALSVDPTGDDRLETISLAFLAVQRKAGLKP